ncbi:hypothetical protein N7495_009382 [Penicillium taxi]|uniref:uncharacterized protein n=1 Tax=Penicillium taxi TaxID=168475 RepID=UPI002545A5A5|nr:uncharacterized protein N7495_009382 [Penicillium taxi]KAJ5884872.1 hypothetical protein N7495_009382 [Penicillium taxi]
MDISRSHLDVETGDVLERRHSDTSMLQPQHHMIPHPGYQHPHFAIIFLDHDGRIKVESSPSIAGCGGAIFTPDVTDRFMEVAITDNEAMRFNNSIQAPPSPWDMQPQPPQAEWISTAPADMIPCEWQSLQGRRKRRDGKRRKTSTRDTKRKLNPKSRSNSKSPAPSPSIGHTILRVGDRDLLRRYYEKAFEDFQQLNCRVIAKSYIKLVEPRKQVHFPYNGRKVVSGESKRVDPELTKPAWWPAGVLHKEPDHLLMRDRLRLLVHILCELKDSHGITSERLREASQDVRRQINPQHRLQVLDEIYFVRHMEERYLNGELDGNTRLQVSKTHLPEAIFMEDEISSRFPEAPLTISDMEFDNYDHGYQSPRSEDGDRAPHFHHNALPPSPTSDSSEPHTPTIGFGTHPSGMTQSFVPNGSPKPVLTDPSLLPSYFPQPYPPAARDMGYWPGMAYMPQAHHYGY